MAGQTFLFKGRQVSDDRLRPVPLVNPDDFDPGEPPGRLAGAIRGATVRPVRTTLVILAIPVTWQSVLAGIDGVPTLWILLTAAAFWSVVTLFVMLLAFSFRSFEERRAMGGLKRLARCASCGYSLRGLPPEPDGCVVCPECRAAWRLDVM